MTFDESGYPVLQVGAHSGKVSEPELEEVLAVGGSNFDLRLKLIIRDLNGTSYTAYKTVYIN